MSISEGSKLSITYIGYLDKDVAVSKGKTTLNIQLKEDTQALDEVVVVGYGSVKKRDLTDLFHRFHLHRFRIRL